MKRGRICDIAFDEDKLIIYERARFNKVFFDILNVTLYINNCSCDFFGFLNLSQLKN